MLSSASTSSRAVRRVLGAAVSVLVGVATVQTIPAAPAAAADVAQLRGVQLHSLWSSNTSADVDRQLDLVAGSGSTVARLDVAWSSLQYAGRGIYSSSYTARIDYAVDGAVKRGIQLILTVAETPCWASSAPDTLKQDCVGAYWDRMVTKYAPTDPADFAAVTSWLATRYGSRIAAMELWNEPNYDSGTYYTFQAPDKPLAYTQLVKTAYPAIKAAAPSLPVLAGALSFSDDVFLNALYADGIQGSYDGLSYHPYNEWRAPGAEHDVQYYKYDLVQGTAAIRAARTAAGDTTPLWLTEFGYTTCTIGSGRWCVTEDQQASYLDQAARLVAGWTDVRAFIIYNLRNKGDDATSTEQNFGLVTTGYALKPAYTAVSDAFHALAAPVSDPAPAPAPAPAPPPPPPPAPIVTSIAASSSMTVVYPAVSTVRGRLTDDQGTGIAGQPVVVLTRPAGTTTWTTAGSATSAADGSVTWSGKAVSTDWQLRYDGGPGLLAALGPVTSSPVATSVSVTSSASKLTLGSFLTLSGTVAPVHAGQVVYADVLTATGWTAVTSGTLTSTSSYKLRFKVGTKGAISYRVRKPADTDHAVGTSASVVVTVV